METSQVPVREILKVKAHERVGAGPLTCSQYVTDCNILLSSKRGCDDSNIVGSYSCKGKKPDRSYAQKMSFTMYRPIAAGYTQVFFEVSYGVKSEDSEAGRKEATRCRYASKVFTGQILSGASSGSLVRITGRIGFGFFKR